MVSLSNHEPGSRLVLRQAQDERRTEASHAGHESRSHLINVRGVRLQADCRGPAKAGDYVRETRLARSGEYVFDDVAEHVGQAEVAAGITVGQLLVTFL